MISTEHPCATWNAAAALLAVAFTLSGCAMDDIARAGIANEPAAQDIVAPASGPKRVTEDASLSPFELLDGQWTVERVGSTRFPLDVGIVNFQSDEFFSHEAGCGGGHPAFYSAGVDGSFSTSRREAVRIGKCSTAEAPVLERLLADFIDRATGWEILEGDKLMLSAGDGSIAMLSRPRGPVPALQGEWRVVSIGGEPWRGPEPASISISYNWIGAGAGCNSGGSTWTSPAPGRLVLGSVPTTLMLCDDALMQAEETLFDALRSVTGYELDGVRLTLTGARPIRLEVLR